MIKIILPSLMLTLLLVTTPIISSGINLEKEVFINNLTQLTYMNFVSRKTIYVGGSGPGNYSKIQSAIDNASEGDTIFVYDDSSPYNENIKIKKTITLKGEDRNTTVISAVGGYHVVYIKASYVELTGFTITNGTEPYDQILIISSNYNKIYGNIVANGKFNGIEISSSNYNIIQNCIISNSKNVGIMLYDSSYNNISNNKIMSNNRGIDLYYSTNNTVYGNLIDNNYDGLGLYWGSAYHSSSYNIIKKNVISNNAPGDGICLLGKSSGELTHNIITENNVTSNIGGITLCSYTSNNMVYHNNVINNVDNGYDVGYNNIWYNGKEGNYWGDYREKYPNAQPRQLRPWIWNTPYKTAGESNSKDRFPLVNQYTGSIKSRQTQKALHYEKLFYVILSKINNIFIRK